MSEQLPPATPLYRTPRGTAYVGDSLQGMRDRLEDESVSLFMTSPPFALQKAKEYGNKPEDEYIDWFREFALVMWDKLREDGSLVIDLGGAWRRGRPVRSLYQFKLLIELCEALGDKSFFLAQDCYWHNPSKMPLPAQWVNVERCRIKDSVNVIWWLSKTDRPKADNRRVLRRYSADMERLLARGTYNHGVRPSGSRVGETSWSVRHKGAIPPSALEHDFPPEEADADAERLADNFLRHGGSESNSRYHHAIKAMERHYGDDARDRIRKHPARFPVQVPTFFIQLLTDPGDLVVDPFAGSNVTGYAAEELDRRWAAFELDRRYLEPSIARFSGYETGDFEWLDDEGPLLDAIGPSQLTLRA